MESITKSIIYGNSYRNNYGKFLPVCSSISDRSAIGSIVEYLKDSLHFSNYGRIAYAYRVEQIPVVFITEKKQAQVNYYEDYHSDETVEGSGQKLMHLLEKFNIRNVFLCVMIQQFNPLMPFEVTNYRAIVENARMLLDQLYRKVISIQEQSQAKNINDLLLHNNRTVKMKKRNMNEQVDIPTLVSPHSKERPSHIYTTGKPTFLVEKVGVQTYSHETNFLWDRCKVMKENYESIVKTLTEKELQQLKYFVMYDRNQIINSVIQMFMTYQGLTKQHLLNQYNFALIKQIPFQNIQPARLRKMEDMLKTNRKLNVDTVMGVNKAMGILFSIMQLAIRFSKALQRITDLLAKSEQNKYNAQTTNKSKSSIKFKKTTINVET